MAIKRRNRHEWESLVAQFEACELTQQEFASLHHVGLASFRGWLYWLRKSAAIEATGFIDIKPTTICASADPSQAFVVLECAHKLRLIFETQPTIGYLAELIEQSVARSTIGSLFHRAALILYPIHQRIVAEARQDPYLHADETSLGVLAKEQCLKGWIWGLMSSRALAYVFAESRRGEVARQLIGDTTGYLTVDGYSGYNELAEHKSQRIRVGCWSHARRKFYAALKSEPRVKEVLKLIVELYLLERRAVIEGIQGTADHLELRKVSPRQSRKAIQAMA